jgi:hypothetical protein
MNVRRTIWCAMIVLCLAVIAGCETESGLTREQERWLASIGQERNLHGRITQWNGDRNDVDGEVGHRIFVAGPRARCLPEGPGGGWSAALDVVSGSLPPGLTFAGGSYFGDIEGIPTERGHWVVKLKLYEFTCGRKSYPQVDFTQELRFHITGTGKVVK